MQSLFVSEEDRQDFHYLEVLLIDAGPNIRVVIDAVGYPQTSSANLVSSGASPITVSVAAGDVNAGPLSIVANYDLTPGTILRPGLVIEFELGPSAYDTFENAEDVRLINDSFSSFSRIS